MVSILGEGGSKDPNSLELFTKKRTRITNDQRMEKPAVALKAARDLFKKKEGSKLKFRSISNTYNCMGLVWASRRTNIYDFNQLEKILHDDEYDEVKKIEEVMVGDILVYYDRHDIPNHIGIVVVHTPKLMSSNYDTWIMSKWGSDGEYIHKLNSDIEPKGYGPKTIFFSERKY